MPYIDPEYGMLLCLLLILIIASVRMHHCEKCVKYPGQHIFNEHDELFWILICFALMLMAILSGLAI